MRSSKRFLLCGAVLAAALFSAQITSSATDASSGAPAAMFAGFGGAVLVGDGEVFVGEAANQFRPGTVYIYRKTGGAWQEAATLRQPNAEVFDDFGSSLTLDDNRLFVGAGPDEVHVFTKQGTTWTHAGSVAASAVTAGEGDEVRFGNAVAASGEWLLVGQQVNLGGGRRGGGRGGQAAPPPPPGKVYAFRRNANGQYGFASTIVSPDDETAGDGFGSAIALAGGTALIGAAGQTNRAGVVHEFAVDAAGTWTKTRDFAPQGVGDNETFGTAVALLGDNAVVAAPGDAGGYGAVYLFRKVQQTGRRGGGGGGEPAPAGGNFQWQELNRLTQPAGSRASGFASSVDVNENAVWIGATRVGGQGAVFVFEREPESGEATGAFSLLASDVDGASHGQSVSIRGNVAAVGATGVDGRRGGVVIYELAGDAWTEQPMLMPELDELPTFTGEERACSGEGKVEMFECGNTELLAFLPPSRLTHDGHYVAMNDIWGWTDPETGTEWALVGRRDGTTFVDMSNPTRPVAVADLPLTDGARPSSWRDIKVYKDHAYIVADSAGQHGMQVFDLTRLRTLKPQADGLPSLTTYDALYDGIASAHNIVINEESGYAYSVGSSGGGETCGGGLHMIDIREMTEPTFVGCFSDTETGRRGTGYSHDAQCVTYKGPDTRYTGHEICIGANENSISVADVTDKQNPKALSRATYPNVAYSHQGWFTDDHRYFFLDDEADEGRSEEPMKTRTMIWDLADLENPILAKEHFGVAETSDHNLYIQGDYMYQANYKSGLRILNISDPENPREVAFFDTAPYTPNNAGYQGAWSVYPFFRSGVIIVNSIEQGLFLVRPADRPIRR